MPKQSEPWLLAVDPGEGNGWVKMNFKGQILDMGNEPHTHFAQFIMDIGEDLPYYVVCEDFRLFRGRAIQQAGSKMITVRMIGMLEFYCAQNKVKFILQPANIKPMAMKYTKIRPHGAHKDNHHIDAIYHGIYFLNKRNLI